jgi:hypothetical protein
VSRGQHNVSPRPYSRFSRPPHRVSCHKSEERECDVMRRHESRCNMRLSGYDRCVAPSEQLRSLSDWLELGRIHDGDGHSFVLSFTLRHYQLWGAPRIELFSADAERLERDADRCVRARLDRFYIQKRA